MTIVINNLRNEKPIKPWQVKVDRSSVLGNPYPLPKYSRDESCDAYDKYFYSKIAESSLNSIKRELNRLYLIHKEHGRLELFCWCAPKRCHAETIKTFLYKHINKG